MKRARIVFAISTVFCATICVAAESMPAAPPIQTEDVERFFRIYEATEGRPTAEVLQRDYLDAGSEGLHQLAKLRNVTGVRIADMIAKNPAMYDKARECMKVLPRVRERLTVALGSLVRLYPQARTPPVTIVVGRGKPVGVAGPATGIQIGLEALCATEWLNPNVEDRFVFVIAHEYIHVQQSAELAEKAKPTVLELSLLEGAAEFAAELIAGRVAYSQVMASTAGREKEIETAFVAEMDSTDLSNWLYNGTVEKPGDLGYWVGYRIARSYYQHATDKQQAFREILEMGDAKALLGKSGWRPGMKL
ncbi:hypothetical protein HNQ60_001894 [Povalibacter uvarum]|uniref:DUF2268 domain-containing protein n=1 Tax=Povalibacter uvarum TaxID=732238 RepID=A0A841HJP9_9GAMM|nr:DUF2268 domain-containing putative Zn-dependent protease [Povalibacter uvarum]MBB6093016.1 hypothetical protein [Povalibacter uvarum]